VLAHTAPADTELADTDLADTDLADTEVASTGLTSTGLTSTVTPIVAKNATPSVTVTGTRAELTLWSMGRVTAAHVELSGPDEAVARLSSWRR
jgi:hypothetical protein